MCKQMPAELNHLSSVCWFNHTAKVLVLPPSTDQDTQATQQFKEPAASKLYMWQKLTLTDVTLKYAVTQKI